MKDETILRLRIAESEIANLTPSMDEPYLRLDMNEIQDLSELIEKYQKLREAFDKAVFDLYSSTSTIGFTEFKQLWYERANL